MTHVALPAFAATSGPRRPKLVLVGEAWGGNEVDVRRPFVGEAGKELFRMLGEAMPSVAPELHARATALHRYGSAWVRERESWLEAAGISMTNVLAFRPPDNKLERLCGTKAEAGPGYIWPAISKGKYLLPEYLPEVERLFQELDAYQPNLILALGNTACWALLRATNIGTIRGAVTTAHPTGAGAGLASKTLLKVLPTYHPAGVLRNWSWRPIVVADLMKAAREAQFPELRRPARRVLVEPQLQDLAEALEASSSAPLVACDIETEAGGISCVGFAWSASEAIVIPFQAKDRPGWSYWGSRNEERQAWDFVKAMLERPQTRLVGQNFVYDSQYLMKMGLRVHQLEHDTMLMHHSLFPELQKGLGFLGSIYTSEQSWKLMRRRKADTEKRDE